ncbi:hypothetical protein R4I72_20295 [Leclercia adecarboxylata]|uniref:hypothetical protein n=1 Tax=Leclercia adecarboxylata TaxID=83655 RepID=UPI0027C59851|nr:hypothetical protein [Leclercia adecarboxylata]MDQ2129516.1 hypothetical protein [Leclercia adecarboxylata]MDV7059376.1 hypothetical protein [Leclercia adecarboxylata]
MSQTKTALHRTRLRFLDRRNFSVLFFYKPDRQTAPLLAAYRKTQTEKIERNFSFFQFHGSVEDLAKNITNRKIRGKIILRELGGSFCMCGVVCEKYGKPSSGGAPGVNIHFWKTEKSGRASGA